MGINLGNTNLKVNFNFRIYREPNFEKLKKELSNFFDKNEILGIKVKQFDFKFNHFENKDYCGIVTPNLESRKFFDVGQDYQEELNEIGYKYNLIQLRFLRDCYGK